MYCTMRARGPDIIKLPARNALVFRRNDSSNNYMAGSENYARCMPFKKGKKKKLLISKAHLRLSVLRDLRIASACA
jgi:hypothetical protein